MKEGISIKENKSLNEFLNIKKIEDKYLYTLDKQIISFIRVYPINTELFSEEELIQKMNSSSVEFSNEQQPYTIFIKTLSKMNFIYVYGRMHQRMLKKN